MNDMTKAIVTHEDDVPFVQALLVAIDAEPFRANRTEYVVIDEYLDIINNNPNNHNNHHPNNLHNNNHHHNDLRNLHNSNNNNNPDISSESGSSVHWYSKVDKSKTGGAWAAGIVLGFMMGMGPSLSIAFGIGAAYYSQQEEGVVGDVARAVGDVALLSHEKFVEVNEKHNLVDTLANGTVAISKNCLEVVRRYTVDSLFSTVDKKNHNQTRKSSSKDAETT